MKLKDRYKKEILPQLKKDFGYKNDLMAPRLEKVVINIGFGRHSKEKSYIENIEKGLTKIAGQKPVLTVAKKSISAFKVRQGMTIGAKVTLRGERMYDFVDKLVNVSFPRVRDFRGLDTKAIDRKGNLTVGLKEYAAFPEIKAEDIQEMYGLEVSLSTTAKNREEGLALFNLIGFPFKKETK